MKIIYTSKPKEDQKKQIIAILREAFDKQYIAENTEKAFFSGYISKYENFVLLEKNKKSAKQQTETKNNAKYWKNVEHQDDPDLRGRDAP